MNKTRFPKWLVWLAWPSLFLVAFVTIFRNTNPSVFVKKQKRDKAIMGSFISGAIMVSFIFLSVKFGELPALLIPACTFALLLVYFLFLYMRAVGGMATRINALIFTAMDAGTLAEELPVYLKMFGRPAAAEPFRRYFEAWHCMLMGRHEEALGQLSAMEMKMPVFSANAQVMEAVCRLRCGEAEAAAGYCLRAEQAILMRDAARIDAAQAHAVGLHYLESGEANKARWFLSATLRQPHSHWVRLSVSFDLARLEEREGNAETAIELYKQAAALGPKTWMGQEAARRAEALEKANDIQISM